MEPASAKKDKNRAQLKWVGGTILGDDLVKFDIYAGKAPGDEVSFGAPVASVSAYVGDSVPESAEYTWQSGPLKSGTWAFAIVPVDQSGNEGPAASSSVEIEPPDWIKNKVQTVFNLTATAVPSSPRTFEPTSYWCRTPAIGSWAAVGTIPDGTPGNFTADVFANDKSGRLIKKDAVVYNPFPISPRNNDVVILGRNGDGTFSVISASGVTQIPGE